MNVKGKSFLIGGRIVIFLMSLFCMLVFSSKVSASPQITAQTSGTVYVNEGEKAALTVTATGSSLKYQWQTSTTGVEGTWGNTTLSGYTTTKLTVPSNNNNGRYFRCKITDKYKDITYSSPVLIKVYYKPVVTTQPVAKDVSVGTYTTFSVAVSSDTAVTYQWYRSNDKKKWAAVSGATAASYSLTAQTENNGLYYRCTVKNTRGQEIDSNPAQLKVHKAISITTQPVHTETLEDVKASLTVAATGVEVKYQWQILNAAGNWEKSTFTGNASNKLTITGIMDNNGRYFRCHITDKYGESKDSNVVMMTVHPKPVINTQPSAKNVNEKVNITFTTLASGDTSLSYQWQRSKKTNSGWKNLENANSASYSMTTAMADNGYYYRCAVTNTRSQVAYTDPAKLTVHKLLVISTEPVDSSIKEDQTAKFTVKATGDGKVNYQWEKRKVGQTAWANCTFTGNKTATLSVKGTFDTKDTEYRCRIIDGFNPEKYSAIVRLSVNLKPKFNLNEPNKTVREGQTFKLSYDCRGDGDITCTWKENSKVIKTNKLEDYCEITLTATADMDGKKYCCVLSDEYGRKATSNSITVHVEKKLTLLEDLQDSVKFVEGKNTTLSIKAQGDGLRYRWQIRKAGGEWENTDLKGYNTAKLTVPGTRAMNGACFRCIVDDKYDYSDSLTTKVTHFYLSEAPVVTKDPEPFTYVYDGETAEMSIEATGDGLKYQWKSSKGGSWSNIKGANDAVYNLETTLTDNGKMFKCEVTDQFNRKVTSVYTLLTVKKYLNITTQPVEVKVKENVKASMSVAAVGDGLKYQWETCKDPERGNWAQATLTGNTTAKLSLTGTEDVKDYYFRCVITDKWGETKTSDAVKMIVYLKPRIIEQPKYDNTVLDGENVEIHVEAEGDGLTYQWQVYKGTAYANIKDSGYNTDTLSLTAYKENNGKKYRCVIKDWQGQTVNTSSALLQVLENPLEITQQPEDIVGIIGRPADAVIKAKGAGLTYQWQKKTSSEDWKNLEGENENKLKKIVENFDGWEGTEYRCLVTDRYKKKAVSDSIKIEPVNKTEIVNYTVDVQHIRRYTETEIFVEVKGVEPYKYHWEEYLEELGDWVTVGNNVPTTKAGGRVGAHRYRCTVTDGNDEKTVSQDIFVYVHDEIVITSQPEAVTVTVGEKIELNVEATGTSLLYKWQKKDGETWADLDNGKAASYEKIASAEVAGVYRCVVYDKAGQEEISNEVTVTVEDKPELEGTEVTAGADFEIGNFANVCVTVKIENIDNEKYFVTERSDNGDEYIADMWVYDGTGYIDKDISIEDIDTTWEYALYEGNTDDLENAVHVAFKGIEGEGNFVFNAADMINSFAEEDSLLGKKNKAYLVYADYIRAYKEHNNASLNYDMYITNSDLNKEDYATVVAPEIQDFFVKGELIYDNGLKVRLYFNKNLDVGDPEGEYYCSDLGSLWIAGNDGQYYYLETADKGGMGIGEMEIAESRGLYLGDYELTYYPISYIFEINEEYSNNPTTTDKYEYNLMNALYCYYYHAWEYEKSLMHNW